MSNIKGNHDPLSIDQLVKQRVAKRAHGVSVELVPTLHTSDAKPSKPANSTHSDIDKDELANQFLGLLFPATTQSQSSQEATGQSTPENLQMLGTNQFFSPLKKQEDSVDQRKNEKTPFSFCIENSSLGAIQLNGQWRGGALQVQLQMPTAMTLQQKKALAAILSRRLSYELGVTTEIEID
ncbi:MAG TPA: hypothetical protein VFV57_12615 [Limnobacter sp.]|nr:hypothetical protein [Limnobacter sp.]